jgi:hypothetical protein
LLYHPDEYDTAPYHGGALFDKPEMTPPAARLPRASVFSIFQLRLLQNFSFATATVKKRSFVARRAKNCKNLCKSNRLLQQAQLNPLPPSGAAFGTKKGGGSAAAMPGSPGNPWKVFLSDGSDAAGLTIHPCRFCV